MTEDGPPDEKVEAPPQDLSVPIWVWVILGFAMVMAVVIVMIIWAGGGKPPDPGPDEEQEVVVEEEEEAALEEAETQPATAPG